MRSNIIPGNIISEYQLPDHTHASRKPGELRRDTAKPTRPFRVYQMSSNDDYFYYHPNTVLLGFLGAVAIILLLVTLAFWVGYKIL